MKNISRWNKRRINYINFTYSDFCDYNNFFMELLQVLQENIQYSLLIKVRYNKHQYGMLGVQIGLLYEKNNGFNNFERIHSVFMNKLSKFMDDYNVEEINSIQLLYVRIEDMPELKIQNLNQVNFKRVTGKKSSKSRFTLIPLTMDENYFGKLILKDRELYLNEINNQRSILKDKNLSLEEISSMYLYGDYIIINMVKDGVILRDVYDMTSCILVSKIEDKIIKENLFIRKIGSNSLTVLNDKVITIESERKLSPIKYKAKPLKDEPNTLIGSWDIEAFNDSDGYAKVYALGFYVLNGKVNTYYLEDGMTSDELVLKCIDAMLVNDYRGYTFYTHNLGRYDATFLIKILKDYNIKVGYEHYIVNAICRDNKPLKITIKVKRVLSDRMWSKDTVRKDPGFNTITLVDSLNLLNQSLDKLCKSFCVEVVKGSFPHKFVSKDTLNYIGNTPSFDNWNNVSLEDYNGFVKPDWNLKEECLKYLEKDLVSLTMIMYKFSEYVNRKYHLQVTDSLTISRLALNIFLKDYLKDSKLPIIGKNMFSDIKEAYYGGITEVYRPYGKNLYYYDVNSLYPFAALNSMPGTNCTFIENIDGGITIDDLFGFFYCEIETTDNYLGLLPVHAKEGLIMPNGKWNGWYFSEELKYALSQGYKIRVLKGYKFNRLEDVFTEYVNNLYKLKSTTKDNVEKDINKRLLNHLLGRFGMNIEKPITELVDGNEFSLIESTRRTIGEPKTITEDDYWVTYYPEVDPEICESHGMDYVKVCMLDLDSDMEVSNGFNDVSLTTAAVVTSYARIYMSKIKLDIIRKGGNLYYTDTDSIVTDIVLDDNLVGNELGQFKLEYKIKRGYFISNKTYCLQLFKKVYDEDLKIFTDTIIKAKSVDRKLLTLDNFKDLYKGISIKATKRFAVTDHSKGSVVIVDNPNVNLNHDSYTKREKLFKRSKWVDTKPLVLESSMIGVKPRKTDKLSKKSKSVKPSKPIVIPNTVKIDNVKGISFIMFKYIPMFIKNKAYFTSVYVGISNIFYYVNMILTYFLTTLGFIFVVLFGICLVSMCIFTKNEAIDYELEYVLESRYFDDYMEEPIEIEIFYNRSYWDQIKGCLNNFINLFSQRETVPYCLHMDFVNNTPQFVGDNTTEGLSQTVESLTDFKPHVDNRPQVLTNVLKSHLDSSTLEYQRLNERLSISEFDRLKRDNIVWEALSMCKRALERGYYESPVLERYSPSVGSIISNVENSSVHSSPPANHQALIDDIVTLLNSPNLSNYSSTLNNSPHMDNAPFSRNSLFSRINSPLSGNSPILSDSPLSTNVLSNTHVPSNNITTDGLITDRNNPLGLRTFVEDTSSSSSSTLGHNRNDSLMENNPQIEGSNNIVETQIILEDSGRNISKAPLRDVYTPSTLRRFGHVWGDNTSIWGNQDSTINKAPLRDVYTPTTLRRFGHVWSNNTSIVEYKPMKRYGGMNWNSPELD